jgi:hypothetical protein
VRIPDEPIVASLFDDIYGLKEPLLCGYVVRICVLYVYMFICLYVYMFICLYAYVLMFLCIYVFMC